MSFKTTSTVSLAGCIPTFLWVYTVIAYVVNFIKFVSCDFASPYKEEIIHGIGVFSYFGASITVWF